MKHAKKFYLATALALTLAFTGCSNQEEKKAEAPVQQTQAEATVAEHATSQPEAPPASAAQEATISGTVVETFDSAGYTYVQLDTGAEKIWAAIGQASVAAGDEISLLNGPVMQDFHSKTLDRTFPEIIFSGGLADAAGGAHGGGGGQDFAAAMQNEGFDMSSPAMGMSGNQPSGGSGKAVTPLQDVHIDKAEGENGYSVEEVYASVADLAGKKVKVRGKAVKVSPNIMGRTWVHLQDGTGNAADNSHDLVVTTNSIPEPNSIVVVEGVVAKDKDFGAGYFYNVIVEEATVSK